MIIELDVKYSKLDWKLFIYTAVRLCVNRQRSSVYKKIYGYVDIYNYRCRFAKSWLYVYFYLTHNIDMLLVISN